MHSASTKSHLTSVMDARLDSYMPCLWYVVSSFESETSQAPWVEEGFFFFFERGGGFLSFKAKIKFDLARKSKKPLEMCLTRMLRPFNHMPFLVQYFIDL